MVYDCLFPWTVGGAERWSRNVAEALVAEGHEVTYLTRRQWADGDEPDLPGIEIIAVSPAEELYGPDGNRTIGQALRFGRGVLRHLAANRGAYDIVHVSVSPYFGLLAAGLARRRGGYRIVTDWHEVWTDEYWREYLGPLKGRVAAQIQRRCARIPQHAFCSSRLHAERLRAEGLRGVPTVLGGQWTGPTERPTPRPPNDNVVFAGRMIPEKHAPDVVYAVAKARERVPELTATIFGAGPELELVRSTIQQLGVDSAIQAPGFAPEEEVQDALAQATCLILPSTREGYGMVVIEAAAAGVPTVLVSATDNAATQHIVEGVNGFVAPSLAADALADGIVAAYHGGTAIRESTADWFAANAERLSVGAALKQVLDVYEHALA